MAGNMKRGAKGATTKTTLDVPITMETTLSQGGAAKRSTASGEKATTRAARKPSTRGKASR